VSDGLNVFTYSVANIINSMIFLFSVKSTVRINSLFLFNSSLVYDLQDKILVNIFEASRV